MIVQPHWLLKLKPLFWTSVTLGALHIGFVAADDFQQRFYLNGGIGVSQLNPESTSDALTIGDDTDSGGHIAVGFDVNRFLSVEGYAASLGTAQVDFLDTRVGSIDYTVFGVSALAYLANSRSGLAFPDDSVDGLFRREGASLYGRLGLGHMRNSASRVAYERDYPNHATFGVGVEYGFENGVALRAELVGIDTDARYLNVGILKRFGDASRPLAAAALPVATPAAASSRMQINSSIPSDRPLQIIRPIMSPFIYFAFDESALTSESMAKLDDFIAKVIDTDFDLSVEGHTDWIAEESYNVGLSVRRAEAVASYLVSKGISQDRVRTIGFGELRPISSNDTAEGRAQNRRTEIVLK